MNPNEITHQIIGAAIDVHRAIGPGQDEALYEDALEIAFQLRGLRCRRQPPLPVHYKGVKLEVGFRPDFVVEDTVVAECKAVELVHPIFAAQVRTYQRLGGWPLGLLLNFNVPVMKEGISRFIVDAAEFKNHQARGAEFGKTQRKNDLVESIIGAAVEVHRILGVGLLNSVYAACLQHELSCSGLKFETDRRVDALFEGMKLRRPAEIGLVVEGEALVAVLSAPKVLPVHEAQARSAMRLGKLPAGIILNFHAKRLVDDLKRLGSLSGSVSSKPLR